MSGDATATGRCLCGALRFETRGEPLWVTHCHCASCRRNTGSAVATFVGVRAGDHRYTRGAPAVYESTPGVRRRFCARCGTPMSYEADRFPGEVHLFLGTLDDPGAFRPKGHVFYAERVPWFEVHDDLPRFDTTSGDGGPQSHGPAAKP